MIASFDIGTQGLGLPLCIAPAVSLAFMKPEYTNANFDELILLITLLLMITALAVLARILADRKLFVSKLVIHQNSRNYCCFPSNYHDRFCIIIWATYRLGSVTMSTTAVDTFIGWVLLGKLFIFFNYNHIIIYNFFAAIVLALYGSRVPWIPPATTCPGEFTSNQDNNE